MHISTSAIRNREQTIELGKKLQYFTIVWNSIEAVVAITAGLVAGSVALVGFGLDSVIEVTSGVALLWRLNLDHPDRRESAEQLTLRIVGICFVALAIYVSLDSVASLVKHEAPSESTFGITVATLSLIVMPVLAYQKRKVARGIGSAAMSADAKQTQFCTYLSAIVLAGLLLNSVFGWWWADPVAGLLMVPIIVKEGIDALRGKSCCC